MDFGWNCIPQLDWINDVSTGVDLASGSIGTCDTNTYLWDRGGWLNLDYVGTDYTFSERDTEVEPNILKSLSNRKTCVTLPMYKVEFVTENIRYFPIGYGTNTFQLDFPTVKFINDAAEKEWMSSCEEYQIEIDTNLVDEAGNNASLIARIFLEELQAN